MSVTFRALSTGRTVTLPEPGDKPARAPQSRARQIARLDASDEWERVEPAKRTAPKPAKEAAGDRSSAEPDA